MREDMITGFAFVISIVLCALILRRSPRLVWWIGGAIVAFAAMFAIVLGLQNVPREGEVAAAYRDGVISYNRYQQDRARARAAYDYAAIAGALGALAIAGLGLLARITAPDRTSS